MTQTGLGEHPKYAVVFPGQGSQSVGMLADIADAHSVVIDTFAEASDVLGYDLWATAQQGPEDALKQTQVTQPLMYTSGIALWRVWQTLNFPQPVVLAGHSLGEFSALTASGALSFNEGLSLVKERAELMAAAVPEGEGGMAAILGMDDSDVLAVCASITGDRIVEAVNFNGPGQVAISGHVDALQKAVAAATERGAKKAIMLPVSVPNHSSLMRDAGAKLSAKIDATQFIAPTVPVMQNTHATVAESLDELLASLKIHVFSPVQWTRAYRTLIDEFQPSVVIELGPGKVLASLGKRIERSVPVVPVESLAGLEKAVATLAAPT